ncbi:ATP-binding protein [Rhizobium sp. Leaf383]|uniref:ATP-binding protein n=1 Tax=Rhizobium sp. Leaf383 TaxID=1736357 RepID=UPI000712CBB2|nr:ATP-binding protein [Rhizobium sp. Leaf383]KQS84820.1 histidine kinase [Rhizobium sp. Leaf383]
MTYEKASEGRSVVICAPFGRDAESLRSLLRERDYEVVVCPDVKAVSNGISDRTGVVVITEEALARDAERLHVALAKQPPWSDIPFVLLAAVRTSRNPNGALSQLARFDLASNSVVLERPLGRASLFSAVASAMRLREKQFLMRDRLLELDESEARLRDLNRDLEDKVTSRTAELEEQVAARSMAEESLRQSQKMEAVGQLTGGIAHDFNNMLTGIIAGINISRRRIAAGRLDEVDRFMDAATDSANRAAALVARLLAFSRRQTLDARPLDTAVQLKQTCELLRSTLPENIAITLRVDPDVGVVIADATQLESALLNIAINARDAMPDGGRLDVSARRIPVTASEARAPSDTEPGAYVVISVTDTGAGMPPDILAKVFEPFFTTKPIGQGAGLGLSMIYGFAQQSGGKVRIDSEPGVGTTIDLYLPASDIAEPEPDQTVGTVETGRGQAVLLVEDDDSVRLLVADIMKELSYTVIQAPDAGVAIPILASDRPIDLMVSDVGLPGMDGRQLAQVARGHRPDLPILFITGYAENAATKASFVGTNMALVAKPFSVDALAAKINEMTKSTVAKQTRASAPE